MRIFDNLNNGSGRLHEQSEGLMPTFSLKIAADRTGEAVHVQFDAVDAADALGIAHREAKERPAELWQDDRKLCTIRRSPVGGDGFWQVS
ncbi:MAG: hypothetical protein EOP50_18300 [Sphingobacteriales bacterium]|nr:MAG: hypothetical protein EOP50_18300 [Sphingobacteriales bacterium]